MATKSAIGRIATLALNDLAESMTFISKAIGVEPLAIHEIQYSDPAYQEAMRLRALADWTAQIALALGRSVPEPEPAPEPEPTYEPEPEPTPVSRKVKRS